MKHARLILAGLLVMIASCDLPADKPVTQAWHGTVTGADWEGETQHRIVYLAGYDGRFDGCYLIP